MEYLNKLERYKSKNLTWESHFLPQIIKITQEVLNKSSEVIEFRANSFELFGFDFAMDKNL